MSRSFFYWTNRIANVIGAGTGTGYIIFQIPIFGILCGGHSIYAYGTQKEKKLIIDKKYIYTNNALSEFMIVDKTGKHYNVNNSVWYWKWNSIEEWEFTSRIKLYKYL